MLETIKKELKRYSRLAYELGLVWGRSGNMSVRIDKDHFLISASSAELRDLSLDQIVTCSIHSDEAGFGNPSMEFRMHRRIYIAREDISSILHAQPIFSTLVACSPDLEIKIGIIPESIAYIKKIERVSYNHPGSIELALEVERRVSQADTLILENHGVVCIGTSLKDVINKTEAIEFLCRLIILGNASGIELKALPEDIVQDFKKMLGIF